MRVLLLVLLVVTTACSAPSALERTDVAKYVVRLRVDSPEKQDAAIDRFVSAVDSGTPSIFVIVMTTVEGQPILFSVEPTPTKGRVDVELVLDARGDDYWGGDAYRVSRFSDVTFVVENGIPEAAHPLTPDIDSPRGTKALRVRAQGRKVFDSMSHYPIPVR